MDISHCALVPCLDSEASVGAVVRALAEHLPVIVVDDGSRDASAQVAEAAGATVVRHERNLGKGAALLTGLAAARDRGFTHIVSVDADGQHLAADLPGLVEASCAAPDALVVGARDFEVENVPGSSKFGRNFSNFWVRLETGNALGDTQSGYRVYPVESTLALAVPPSRFEWEVEVLVRASWAGIPVIDLPVSVFYPPPAERLSHYRSYVDSARISWLHTRLVTRWILRGLHRWVMRVAREHTSPHRLAIAVAVGVLIGCSPFFGFHALIALGSGKLLRLNLAAVVAGSNISLPFVAPVLVFASVQTGHRALHGAWVPLDVQALGLQAAERLFAAWLLGAGMVGAALGTLCGALTYVVVVRVRARE